LDENYEAKRIVVFEGQARIGEIMKGFAQIQLRPEDFSSPLALQMALTRIYEGLMKAVSEGPKKSFAAEVRFTDSLGQTVSFGVDLGTAPPPFSKSVVKARVIVELYEED